MDFFCHGEGKALAWLAEKLPRGGEGGSKRAPTIWRQTSRWQGARSCSSTRLAVRAHISPREIGGARLWPALAFSAAPHQFSRGIRGFVVMGNGERTSRLISMGAAPGTPLRVE